VGWVWSPRTARAPTRPPISILRDCRPRKVNARTLLVGQWVRPPDSKFSHAAPAVRLRSGRVRSPRSADRQMAVQAVPGTVRECPVLGLVRPAAADPALGVPGTVGSDGPGTGSGGTGAGPLGQGGNGVCVASGSRPGVETSNHLMASAGEDITRYSQLSRRATTSPAPPDPGRLPRTGCPSPWRAGAGWCLSGVGVMVRADQARGNPTAAVDRDVVFPGPRPNRGCIDCCRERRTAPAGPAGSGRGPRRPTRRPGALVRLHCRGGYRRGECFRSGTNRQ